MSEKELPNSIEAEEALLGAIIIDIDAYWAVSDLLKPEHFYKTLHRQVYTAMKGLIDAGLAVDAITLPEVLEAKFNIPYQEAINFIADAQVHAPISFNAANYARIIHSVAMRRMLNAAAGRIATLASDESTPIGEVLESAERAIFGVTDGHTTGNVTTIKEAAYDLYETTLERRTNGGGMVGIPTGYKELDHMLDGLQASQLVTLAARPGMGKTALSNCIALNVAKQGKAVAVFNLEMSTEQLMQRLLSIESGLPLQSIRRGELDDNQWHLFSEATGRISNMRIFLDDTPGVTPSQLRARCRRLHAEHGIDLVIIDYLGLMEGDAKNYQNQTALVSYVSRQLKKLSRELNTTVLALSQLNRAVEQRADKHPTLSDLRDSGSVEQDSDTVMFIYRDDYYNPDTSDRPNIAEIQIAKQRQGATGTVDLYWNGRLTKFSNLDKTTINL